MGSDVRYIVLSDLHLGAENSILTSLQPGTALADSQHASPVLTALVECLRHIVAANEGDELPTLIAAAGPSFWQETTRPRFAQAPLVPAGRVEVGTPEEKP